MTLAEIQERIKHGPMSGFQMMIVAIGVTINMIDGFDILAASFVSPIISREWGLGPEQLGVLFAAGPLGMAAGAFFLSPIADLFGRRNSIMLCLSLMSIGMLFSALAQSLGVLTVLRFITGLGVGAMASSVGTMVFEFSNLKSRNLGLGLVTVGYPFGATVGGLFSVWLIEAFSWRAIFVFGGLCSLALILLVYLKMPESLDFLMARRPKRALEKVNGVLAKLGFTTLEALPPLPPRAKGEGSLLDLLRPPILSRTLMMSLSYFLYMLSSYFILNWANQLTTDAGFSDTSGLSISILINLGGIAGGIAVGLLSFKYPFRPVATVTMVAMGIAIMGFGAFGSSLLLVGIFSVFIGFGIFGAAVVLYATAATTFPVRVRATGIGLAMSAGRLGSVVGPYTAGVLLGMDMGRVAVCLILALPVIVAAATLVRVPLTPVDDGAPSGDAGALPEPKGRAAAPEAL